jgi:hypothetical protein
MTTAAFYRTEAARCSERAEKARSAERAKRWQQLAEEYLQLASQLERAGTAARAG